MKFVVSHLDQQLGPFDEATLKTKWLAGEFLPIDYVFDEAKQDWVLISDRFEWAKKPAQASPPPIKADQQKKATPPPAPKEAIAAAATSPKIHIGQITVPTLNVPVPVEVEPIPEIELTSTGIDVERTKVEIIPDPARATAPAPAPKPSTDAANAQLKMVNGVAEVDLSKLTPGDVEIILNNAGQEIKLNLQVRSAEPSKIEWTIKSLKPIVGNDCEITCKAHDKNGHFCPEFKGPFTLKANDREIHFEMENGTATVKFQQTRAEACELTLVNRGSVALQMPLAFKVDWQPGPAVRLVVDGSPELVAGSLTKVQVKAVDQYGNLANTFQGTLNVEVKAG